jgi:hypothetical protein
MKLRLSFLGALLLAAALNGAAETQDPSNATSGSPKPPASTKDSPKIALTAAPEKQKTKKVWTNDDIGGTGGKISVVGDTPQQKTEEFRDRTDFTDNGSRVREKQLENYRGQIRQLHGQITAADQRMAELKNFKGENNSPSGGIKMYQGYNMVPVEEQVKQLEEKKKRWQAQIEDLENEARKNGFDPGELR